MRHRSVPPAEQEGGAADSGADIVLADETIICSRQAADTWHALGADDRAFLSAYAGQPLRRMMRQCHAEEILTRLERGPVATRDWIECKVAELTQLARFGGPR